MNMQFIFLIVLGVVSAVYLVSLSKTTIFQYVLKGCLIPLVFAVYITGANTILLPIILALVFAWIGDILLIKISNLWCFRLGLASFLIGHICYIIAMFEHAQPLNIPVLVISIVIAATLGFLLFKTVKPTNEMKNPVIAYEAIILVMAIFALQLFLSQGSYFGAFVLAGSICFVASDTSLAFVTFQKKPYYVFCMATYIAAQLLITLGFCAYSG
jgi:uncharacterized membrane protein YhhN